jgi:ribosome recycling factor
MTEDRRKDLVKVLKKLGEEFKVGVRNERQDALNKIKKSFQAKEITEDAVRLFEQRIQKATDSFTKQIDDQLTVKEKEILTV